MIENIFSVKIFIFFVMEINKTLLTMLTRNYIEKYSSVDKIVTDFKIWDTFSGLFLIILFFCNE